ncbi:MAG: phage tail tape measure protein [Pirellulaceae bacterium]|nr:phage tail tape measure protein [Pirellulaceae bacterium]
MAAGQAIRAGAAYIELFTKDSRMVKGLRSASQKLEAFGASVQGMGLQLVAAGGAVIAPLLAAVQHFATAGDQVNKASDRTGVAVEALSELAYAADQSGANLETLEGGLRRMQASVLDAAKGSKSAQENLAMLGLTVEQLAGLSPDQQFKLIADRLSRIEDPTLKAAMAMKIFGKSGTQLLPLMAGGAKGIEELQQRARELGLTISKEDADAATLFGDTLDDLWKSIKAGVFAIGAAMAPMLTDLIAKAIKFVVAAVNWIKQNKALVVTVFKIAAAVVAAGIALIALGGIISGLGAGIGAVITVVGAIGTAIAILGKVIALLLSPIGLVIVAAVALGAYLLYASGLGAKALAWLGERFETLKNDALAAWQGIGDALAAGDLALAAKIVWLTLKMEWRRGIHFLNGLWIGAKEFFLSLWTDAVFGVAKILNNGWAAIEVGWTETVGFLADAWSVFTNLLTHTWHNTIGFIKKAWVRLKSLFSDEVDVDAEVNQINREVSEATGAADQQMLDAVGQRDRERRERRDQIERDRAGAESALGDMQSEEHARRQKQFADDLAETEGELSDARKEWQDAIAEAAKKRAAAETSDPERLKQVEDSLSTSGGVLAEEQRKVEAKGTFNALAARGLGADSLAERTARAAEQIVVNTKDLLAQAKQGKLVFAP